MPKPTFIRYILRMHRRGDMADHQVVGEVIDLAAETDPSELLSQLPDDLLAKVRQKVNDAPSTDDGWDRSLFIVGGTYHGRFDMGAARAVYRAGVEALRGYFSGEV